MEGNSASEELLLNEDVELEEHDLNHGGEEVTPIPGRDRSPYDAAKTYRRGGPECEQEFSEIFSMHQGNREYGATEDCGSPHARAQYMAWEDGAPAIKDTSSPFPDSPGQDSPPSGSKRSAWPARAETILEEITEARKGKKRAGDSRGQKALKSKGDAAGSRRRGGRPKQRG